MKLRTIVIALAVCFLGAGVCLAQDSWMGTWKLNESKSKFSPGSGKNSTVVYEAAGDNVKVTVDGVDGSGKPAHNEWTGKFDGKEYQVTGDANQDMRSYKKIDDHTLSLTGKKGGKTTLTARITLAADGKTRTVTSTGTDSSGKKMTNTAVYDKQ